MLRYAMFLLLLTTSVSTAGEPVKLAKPNTETLEFFENKVRPLLVEHCTRCHGEKKQQAELRLDNATGVAKGSDGGAIIAPGKPDSSKLIHVIKSKGDDAMPPSGPLSDEQIEVLVAWVKLGSPFPEDATTQQKPSSKEHWAFKPISDPAVPTGDDANPIDRFLRAKLTEAKLDFAPLAPREVLIRRAYYDLIGLPPTASQVQNFVNDKSPNAYEKLLDELLASPHYGERWGRWWLDIARYADSKGYVFQEDRNYPYAYTYRDYVIRSLNADKPFNRFVQEQIAADQLDLGKNKADLAAMGFLTVGRRFSNNINDITDDRIDVVTRGFMGLTVQCARCHDHKFDPIGIADYYSLYGVFAASTEPKDNFPIIGEVPPSKAYDAFLAKVAVQEKEITDYKTTRHAKIVAELRTKESLMAYLTAVVNLQGKPQAEVGKVVREGGLRTAAMTHWLKVAASEPWKTQLTTLKDKKQIEDFAQNIVAALNKESKLSPKERDLVKPFLKGGELDISFDEYDRLILRDDKDKVTQMQAKLDKFRANSPFNPPRAMVLNDVPKPPSGQQIFLRGNPNNTGPVVPRQFVSLTGEARKPFTKGSGRLELSEAIVSPTNPLTARVLVNRVWLMHFGQGIVRTPSDFGLRSDAPSHPELLDWLSTRFMQDGWSLKKLHRRMMTSRAYMQNSNATSESQQRDPENKRLSHANRRRLDFEGLRDSLLAVSGKLDRTMYGRSVNLFELIPPTRRTVYASIDRQNLPGTLRSFDFPSPDTHSPQRYQTTVPQQALYFLNSPFAIDQARTIAHSPSLLWHAAPERRIEKAYLAVLQRKPTVAEVKMGVEFIKNSDDEGLSLFVHALLCSNEFAFID